MAKKADTKRVRMRTVSASPEGVFPAGSERALPADVAAHLIQTGQAVPVEQSPAPEPEPAPEPQPSEPKSDESEAFPVHQGAGWYKLSNGDTVRGEEEAIEAEAALQKG